MFSNIRNSLQFYAESWSWGHFHQRSKLSFWNTVEKFSIYLHQSTKNCSLCTQVGSLILCKKITVLSNWIITYTYDSFKTHKRFHIWFFGWWDYTCKIYSIFSYSASKSLLIQAFPQICKLDTAKLICSDTHKRGTGNLPMKTKQRLKEAD